MHLEVLNNDQKELLPLLEKFNKEFYMVGGTSIALHIGHRLSIDFDLFKTKMFRPKKVISTFESLDLSYTITLNIPGMLNLICNDVKFTFFQFDFDIPHKVKINKSISIPNLLDLASMKAYALGHRSKWKDYVDLYFLLKNHYTVEEISLRSKELFGSLFSEKLFRAQLCYFVGINYAEVPVYLPGFEVTDEEVKSFLIEIATR